MGSFDKGRALGQSAINTTVESKLQRERQDMLRNQFVMERQMKQAQMDIETDAFAAMTEAGKKAAEWQADGTYNVNSVSDLWSEYGPRIQRSAKAMQAFGISAKMGQHSKSYMTSEMLKSTLAAGQEAFLQSFPLSKVPTIGENKTPDTERMARLTRLKSVIDEWPQVMGEFPDRDEQGVIDENKIIAKMPDFQQKKLEMRLATQTTDKTHVQTMYRDAYRAFVKAKTEGTIRDQTSAKAELDRVTPLAVANNVEIVDIKAEVDEAQTGAGEPDADGWIDLGNGTRVRQKP